MSGLKRIFFLPLVVSLVGLAGAPMRVRAATHGDPNKKPFVPEQCIIVPAPGASIDQINAEYGSTTVAQVGDTYLVQLPNGTNVRSVVRVLRTRSYVQAAGTNNLVASPAARRPLGRHQTQTFPNDLAEDKRADRRTDYDTQAFVDNFNLDAMTGPRGAGVTVAVIDTGVDLTHPDLAGHFAVDAAGHVIGADFVDGDDDPTDAPSSNPSVEANAAFGHGTFIAGLIAKIAPDARIMPIRALGADGIGQEFNIIRAVQFAVANHAQIISMSFGAPEKLDGLDEVLDQIHDNTVLLAAAGNNGTDREAQFPADEGFVLAVAAVDNTGVKTPFSNYGSLVDLAAPGDRIVSTYPDGKYATWSGTSFATPMAAATAALVVSHRLAGGGSLDAGVVQCVRQTLVDTGRSLDAIPANNRFRGKIGRLIDPAAAFGSLACGGGGPSGHADLRATDKNDRRSQGEAEYVVNGAQENFEVKVDGLSAARYTLRVTTTGGTVVTDTFAVSRGQARLEYSSAASGDERPLPADLSPVSSIQTVEVLRADGTVILSGSFSERSNGDDHGSGGDGTGGDDGGGMGGDDGGGGDGTGDDGGGGSGGDGGGGGGSESVDQTITLSPVGTDADASGTARRRVEGTRQRFQVEVANLDQDTTYDVFANGMLIGTITTYSSSSGELSFDSDHGPLPPAIDPVTNVSSVDISGPVGTVLSGSF